MRGLRYVGAFRALGLQQEAPRSPADSGPSGLDLGEQISRITNWKAASSKLASQERAEGHGAPGSMC